MDPKVVAHVLEVRLRMATYPRDALLEDDLDLSTDKGLWAVVVKHIVQSLPDRISGHLIDPGLFRIHPAVQGGVASDAQQRLTLFWSQSCWGREKSQVCCGDRVELIPAVSHTGVSLQ